MTSKEWMGRVGDFDIDLLLLWEDGWVIERGIKVMDRSIVLTGLDCGKRSATG
jgi:hypothetical protein